VKAAHLGGLHVVRDICGLDAVVVGAPCNDGLFDLLTVEVLGDGALGQGGDFGVGREAEADELFDG